MVSKKSLAEVLCKVQSFTGKPSEIKVILTIISLWIPSQVFENNLSWILDKFRKIYQFTLISLFTQLTSRLFVAWNFYACLTIHV